MLSEHLSQEHNLASRRAGIIDQHVEWIHQELLHGQLGRVLDLGCGPGLYTSRLAGMGHDCTGIDFSPASIDYARSHTGTHAGNTTYRQADIRTADYSSGYDLVMLIFGELNMFTPADAGHILRKARAALRSGGQIVCEAHTFDFVRAMGEGESTWRTATTGLFAQEPHLILSEHFWDSKRLVATQRTFVVHAESAQVDRFVETTQAYSMTDYESLLKSAGFSLSAALPAMPGLPNTGEFLVLLGEAVEAGV